MTKRYAEIARSRCAACGECVYVCPREAVSIQKGRYAQVDCERCVGCGLCGKSCPAGCIAILQREAVPG